MSFLTQLNWRYATKKFDSSRPVEKDLETKILEAARFAPTSFGLQPFHITVVTDPAIRESLKAAAWGQDQFTSASAILVFSARTDLLARVDQYVALATGGNDAAKDAMKDYIGMMQGSVTSRTAEEAKAWAARQTYIALGFALAAAAELEVDACPMEGFDADQFKTILNLDADFYPMVSMAIGYRSPEDTIRPKTRFPAEDIVDFR